MKKGFTLLELLAVIVVLAIITLIAIPIMLNVIEKSKLGALKDSAYGLIDEANIYYAQYHPATNLRFDIEDGVISSNDTDKLLSYKGSIADGSIVLTSYGKVAICINDGEHAAYKNLTDKEVIMNNEKNCSIPEGQFIIYLDGNATIDELNNQELTAIVQQLQTEVAELKTGANPIGTIIAVGHTTLPSGYLECNGQAVSRSTYSELFSLIGTTYGEGDGSSTFNVPDLRGEFLRGAGTNSHANQGNGANVGVHQDGTYHVNLYASDAGTSILARKLDASHSSLASNQDAVIKSTVYARVASSNDTSASNATAKFTSRPTNTSVLYAIRAK